MATEDAQSDVELEQRAIELMVRSLQVLQEEPAEGDVKASVIRIGRAVQGLWQAERSRSRRHDARHQAFGLVLEARALLGRAGGIEPRSRLDSLARAARLLDEAAAHLGKLVARSDTVEVVLPPAAEPERRPERASRPSVPEGAERRLSGRIRMEVGIGMRSDTNFYVGLSEDISTGGLFVATYDLLPVGTGVDLTFVMPGGYDVRVSGVVRWVRETEDEAAGTKPGIGVQFRCLTPEAQRVVEQFIRRRAALFYDD